ncbi:Ig-like domain-containing protein [Aeromonas sp. HMWF016]|uniref:Ig-like domain-containing protein n=1 Tax=Aeromonas sp. HMWF016 TaxID=2056852 RepID=UPI000D34F982|nr:Ig-like domain-containing protein [Aeromonas sp. HMWF016]PTT46218.1 hypothetical protein DBR09_11570 [Aeromonas sp. HMWF016]
MNSIKSSLSNTALETSCTSGAKADGVSTNIAKAVVTDDNGYLENAKVDFRINNGDAVFSNGKQSTTMHTNSKGEASATLTDTTAEKVSLLITSVGNVGSPSCEFTESSGGGGDFYPPYLPEQPNTDVYLTDLSDPVIVDIIPWPGMQDGDEIILTLSGENAAGFAVPDFDVKHRISDPTEIIIALKIAKRQFNLYGGTHQNEYGRLTLSYTVNGQVFEGTSSHYNIFGKGIPSDIFVTAHVTQNNQVADGTAQNVIEWHAKDENGIELTDIAALASVSGNATLNESDILLPATLYYTDVIAETVTATVKLQSGDAENRVSLTFKEKEENEVCTPIQSEAGDFYGVTELFYNYMLEKGNTYQIHLQDFHQGIHIKSCRPGSWFDPNTDGSIEGEPDIFIAPSSLTFTSAAYGNFGSFKSNLFFMADQNSHGVVCIKKINSKNR